MPDSGKFKDLYLNSTHTYPCQGPSPEGQGSCGNNNRCRTSVEHDPGNHTQTTVPGPFPPRSAPGNTALDGKDLTMDNTQNARGDDSMTDWEKCPAVESIPGKHSGEWLFTKTRVPVSALFGNLAEGATIEEFLDWFAGVEEWQVRAAFEHVASELDAKVKHENPA